MPYLGDFKEDSTLYFCWSTNDKNGAAVTYTPGTMAVYKDDNDSQSSAGITTDRDFDSITGVHNTEIVLTDAFYEAGHDYSVVVSGITVDEETVNAVLATFSIENRFAGSMLFEKAAKMLVNKAVQDKVSGEINYYDDDGETVILTHTPVDAESTITRTTS